MPFTICPIPSLTSSLTTHTHTHSAQARCPRALACAISLLRMRFLLLSAGLTPSQPRHSNVIFLKSRTPSCHLPFDHPPAGTLLSALFPPPLWSFPGPDLPPSGTIAFHGVNPLWLPIAISLMFRAVPQPGHCWLLPPHLLGLLHTQGMPQATTYVSGMT